MDQQSCISIYILKIIFMRKNKIFYYLMVLFLIQGCTSKFDYNVPDAIPPVSGNSELIISEISTAINTDPNAGGMRNHYVELYNGTTGSVDLSNYAIGYQACADTGTLNPWSFAAGNFLTLHKTIAAGKCYVIINIMSDTALIKGDTTWGSTTGTSQQPLQLSGNSAIALLKKDAAGTYNLGGTNYKIIDEFGDPNVARVTASGATSTRTNICWPVAGSTDTRNRIFWRNKTVTGPTINWLLSEGTSVTNSQWTVSGDRLWDYTNVGLPTK
jgi:hypothetical protein